MRARKQVTQFMLELYHLNAVTNKERKIIEEALANDDDVRTRYEGLKRLDKEIKSRLKIDVLPVFTVINNNKIKARKTLIGIGIAAIFACILTFAVNYFSGHTLDNTHQNVQISETDIDSIKEEFIQQKDNFTAKEEIFISVPSEKEAVSIAEIPDPQQEIYTRGGSLEQIINNVSEQKNTQDNENLNIPPGITFIFEAMFANKQLTEITIPPRITSVGKNAFADNPIISVTIGANVSVEENAIPGNFSAAYNQNGKAAGTYERQNTASNEWAKK